VDHLRAVRELGIAIMMDISYYYYFMLYLPINPLKRTGKLSCTSCLDSKDTLHPAGCSITQGITE
jgi:hypothetical protein